MSFALDIYVPIISAYNLCGISGHATRLKKKCGMPYKFDLWVRSFTLQNPRDLSAILTYKKQLGHYGAQGAIIWAP
jgi:hypothetical protein